MSLSCLFDSTAALLKLNEHPVTWGSLSNAGFDSGLGGALRLCISNELPSDVDAAGLGIALCVCRLKTMVGPQLAAHPIHLEPGTPTIVLIPLKTH